MQFIVSDLSLIWNTKNAAYLLGGILISPLWNLDRFRK